MNRWITAVAITGMLSCGGVDNPVSNQYGGSAPLTLSGALTGTYDCGPVATSWGVDNTGAFGFSVPATISTPAINVTIGWIGQPHVGYYKSTDSGAQGGATVELGAGATAQVWAASVGSGSALHGSYTLVFSNFSNTVTGTTGTAYTAHGTLDATLDPLTGQNGLVTLHATF